MYTFSTGFFVWIYKKRIYLSAFQAFIQVKHYLSKTLWHVHSVVKHHLFVNM